MIFRFLHVLYPFLRRLEFSLAVSSTALEEGVRHLGSAFSLGDGEQV